MSQFDIEKQTSELTNTTVSSIKRLFPIKGKSQTLKLTKIWADDKLDPEDYPSQFKAKVGERTWGIPIYGSFELVDKDGKVTSYDAALIAQFAIGLPRLVDSHIGEWIFLPAFRSRTWDKKG